LTRAENSNSIGDRDHRFNGMVTSVSRANHAPKVLPTTDRATKPRFSYPPVIFLDVLVLNDP
jgi:hypothetical protein